MKPSGSYVLGLGHLAGGDQVEHAIAFDQIDFALAVRAELS